MSGTLAIIGYDYDLDEMEKDVPLCSMEEFRNRLQNRDDIFQVDKDKFLRNVQSVCLVLAVISGIWLSHQTYIKYTGPEAVSFIQQLKDGKKVTVQVTEIDREQFIPKPKPQEVERPKQLHARKQPKVSGDGKRKSGGDPRSRKVFSQGVLGILSSEVRGDNPIYSDPLAKGGYAKDIDAILAGVGGLKEGNNAGTGRKGVVAMGFGPGAGGGFGDGIGGGDDILPDFIPNDNVKLRIRDIKPNIAFETPKVNNTIIGGRSRASIMRVVQTNLISLRYAYNKRLREVPNLKGKIKIKFAVDEFGKVIFCDVVNSSMGDEQLEKILVSKIKHWVFDKIDKPGDVTEIIYPFVFSM